MTTTIEESRQRVQLERQLIARLKTANILGRAPEGQSPGGMTPRTARVPDVVRYYLRFHLSHLMLVVA